MRPPIIKFMDSDSIDLEFNQIISHVIATGETIFIMKDNQLAVKIVPMKKKLRQLGLLKHADFWIADDFDATNEAIEKLFHGENQLPC